MQETTLDLELAAREPERQDVNLDNLPAVAPPALLPQQAQKGGCAAWWHHTRKYAWIVVRHTTKHTGVGIVCAVAYFDPGYWGVDLQAGSEYGSKLLFVALLAGIFAIVFQTQASRLGCVTVMDLASHSHLLFYDRPKHKLLWHWLALYPLYALAEIAIVSTDRAEPLGSAIALSLLRRNDGNMDKTASAFLKGDTGDAPASTRTCPTSSCSTRP
ncbi:hypothetical protein DICSQDRAFT_176009 [Dichomitus squalens LYAD-421 SS1]|uniref:Natural resistance-associated macrophage protein-domain-containing protein n=1 Tax=Dichomitus squalens (strain LYAD-421) TaxID=732165 RepID=R7SGU2_DICSQ|nr:uncharacterized protein DICSQDRAFT_176009 [Dichomitus squalens LYAD-421 SS1]EJF55374.1 hypothetical protein DICSQDRAFT_176009 [Dichomitus squalens LYAD-421 SS1]